MKLVLYFTILNLFLLFDSKVFAYEHPVTGINQALNMVSGNEISNIHKSTIFSPEEIEVLYRIVEAEATDQDIKAKKNVASVIVNRVKAKQFPNKVSEVVFQKQQFSPIGDGRYWKVEITEETKDAVNDVLTNGITTDALYFTNLNNASRKMRNWFTNELEFLFKDSAGHSFFKERG